MRTVQLSASIHTVAQKGTPNELPLAIPPVAIEKASRLTIVDQECG